ncbi:MAG: hypothetical protein JST16_03195 [Bdellovibrionales bacterium]|nr:hypothetical protein [Bdellovibrionales bacterium]
MASKNPLIDDSDLSEPAREISGDPASYAEQRRWKLLFSALVFVTLYASVHRLWVPLGLKLTPLASSPYAKIDLYFIPSIFLTFWLKRRAALGWMGSFWCGTLIGWAILESFDILSGRVMGWLPISHFVSAWPLAVISIALLSQRGRNPFLSAAWTGALLMAFLMVARSGDDSAFDALTPSSERAAALKSDAPSTALVCGAQILGLNPNTSVPKVDHIVLQSCGFIPSLAEWGPEGKRLENQSSALVNAHLVIHDGHKVRTVWNQVVRAGETRQIPFVALGENEIAILFSDSSPAAGLTVFVGAKARPSLRVQRSPLEVVRVP